MQKQGTIQDIISYNSVVSAIPWMSFADIDLLTVLLLVCCVFFSVTFRLYVISGALGCGEIGGEVLFSVCCSQLIILHCG